MKYFISILCIALFLFLGIFWEFSPLFFSVGAVLLVVVLFLWEYNVLTRNFLGDFELKSQRKSINIANVILAILWTTFNLFESNKSGRIVNLYLLFWALPMVDVIMYFIYKKKTPTTIFIDNDTFTFNNRWVQKRDLKNLTYIGIKMFTAELELGFKKKSDVRISFKEYDKKDFRKFLDILVEKSEHNVYLTDDVIEKFPSVLSNTVK